jgi:hypothetical protein
MATSTLGSGTLVLAGTTSGTTTVTATAVAGTTTLTLPAVTDTLVGRTTTDTLTNKTLTGAAMNGTVGATTPSTGAFTTLSATGNVTLGDASTDTLNVGNGGLIKDSSGNLGLGVTPSAWSFTGVSFDIAGNGSLFGGSTLRTAGVYLGSNVYYTASGDAFRYKVSSQEATLYESAVGKHIWSTAGAGTAGNAITFTQAMTLDTSGKLLVGTTSAGGNGLTIFPFGSGGSTTQINFNRTSSSTLGYPIVFQNGSSDVGFISQTNTVVAYVTASDYRLKNTIAPMTGALAKVALLKPCTYKWNADGSDGQGFIAHELAEVVPQCVTGQKDAVDADGKPKHQGIDTSFLVATLTAAIQEQQALITTLTARITALESA